MTGPKIATPDVHCPHCGFDLMQDTNVVNQAGEAFAKADPEGARSWFQEVRKGVNFYDVVECRECNRPVSLAGTQELADEHPDGT